MEPPANLVVTGIPRSGTTLVAALLDNTENTICLREPNDHVNWLTEAKSAEDYVNTVLSDFNLIRDRIRDNRPVLDRRVEAGKPLTNYFLPKQSIEETRSPAFEMMAVETQHLQEGFTLATKHNVEYTSVLPQFAASGKIAILCPIRNPIVTILSWNTLTTPVAYGAIPMAKYFWPDVERRLDPITDLIERQVVIFDMFCERFWALRSHIKLVRYEHLLEDQSLVSTSIGRRALAPINICDGNQSTQYDWNLASKIYTAINDHARFIDRFYADAELRSLLFTGS